jgi:hypothetical protein
MPQNFAKFSYKYYLMKFALLESFNCRIDDTFFAAKISQDFERVLDRRMQRKFIVWSYPTLLHFARV